MMANKYKIAEISAYYSKFLDQFYNGRSSIEDFSYADQLSMLTADRFAECDSLSVALSNIGHETLFVIYNATKLYQRWAVENNISPSEDPLMALLKKFRPEIIFCSDIYFLNKYSASKLRSEIPSIKLIAAFHFAPFNKDDISMLNGVDIFFSANRYFVNYFHDLGLNSYLLPHAFDQSILSKITEFPQKISVSFCGSFYKGNGFHQKRLNLIESILKNKIDIQLFANVEVPAKAVKLLEFYKKTKICFIQNILKNIITKKCPNLSWDFLLHLNKPLFGLDYYSMLANSEISLNSHGDISTETDSSGNMRMFETTGLGSCLLTDWYSDTKDFFEPDYEIVTYKSTAECLEKLNWLQNNPETRKSIALAGQKKCHKKFSYSLKADMLIEYIMKKINN